MTTGAVLAGLSVAAGAFGAHMLKSILEPPMLAAYETAARYQMYHAIGMMLAGLAATQLNDRRLIMAAWFFVAGIVLFSGSLYGIALFGLKWLGPVTPLGGLAFMAGWATFAWRVLRGAGRSTD